MAKNISNISIGLNDYLKNDIKNSTFDDLQTDYKTIIDAINELANPESLFADYQLKNDSNLETNDKTVVGAINELFQDGNSVKQKLVDALIAKNVTDVSTSDTFETLLQRLMELDNCPIQAFEYTFNVAAGTTISLQPSRVLLMSTNKTDWGDGTKDTSTSHTYVDAGVYKVKTPYSVVSAINNYSGNTVNSLTGVKIINLDNYRDADYIFYNCRNLTGSPACGNNVTTMGYAYTYCYSLTGSPVCGPNVKNMSYVYCNCNNLTGSPACGPNVTTMGYAYYNCFNLTGAAACGLNVTSLFYTYYGCSKLTGPAACGDNVINMQCAYYNCWNLTGSPACGNKVDDMKQAYLNCINLTGNPVCGPNVRIMTTTYSNCSNLTGSPVCGPNVTDMAYAYDNCVNLTGSPVCGPNVVNMAYTYYNCYNLTGDMFILSDNVSNITNCFNSRNTSNKLYIYVNKNTTSLNSCLVNNSKSLVGSTVTWTNTNRYHYDPQSNIYIRPVDNVAELEAKHKYKIVTYSYPDETTERRTVITTSGGYTSSEVGTKKTFTCDGQIIRSGYKYLIIYEGNEIQCDDLNSTINLNDNTTISFSYISNWDRTYVYFKSNNALTQDLILVERPTLLFPIINEGNYTNYEYDDIDKEVTIYKNNIEDDISYISFEGQGSLEFVDYVINTVTNMANSYRECSSLKGQPPCGPNVTNMYCSFALSAVEGPPVCGDKVNDMSYAYSECYNLTGSPACGPNVTNMASAYYYCNNLTGNPVCGSNVTNMTNAYTYCYNLTGNPVCGPNVNTMYYAYKSCTNLTGQPVCGPNVTNMAYSYHYCYNITGNPVCGNNVANMAAAYYFCQYLNGSPVCGDKVTDMGQTYANCYRLTGSPVCGDNVTNMYQAYANCYNLTGSPACGNKVTNMAYAYNNCSNLTGSAIIGPNVTHAYCAYKNCKNISGNAYIYSNSLTNSASLFNNKSANRLNIYVHANTTAFDKVINTSSSYSITGQAISYTNNYTTNGCYYNTSSNVYIYPVANVAQQYEQN